MSAVIERIVMRHPFLCLAGLWCTGAAIEIMFT